MLPARAWGLQFEKRDHHLLWCRGRCHFENAASGLNIVAHVVLRVQKDYRQARLVIIDGQAPKKKAEKTEAIQAKMLHGLVTSGLRFGGLH